MYLGAEQTHLYLQFLEVQRAEHSIVCTQARDKPRCTQMCQGPSILQSVPRLGKSPVLPRSIQQSVPRRGTSPVVPRSAMGRVFYSLFLGSGDKDKPRCTQKYSIVCTLARDKPRCTQKYSIVCTLAQDKPLCTQQYSIVFIQARDKPCCTQK